MEYRLYHTLVSGFSTSAGDRRRGSEDNGSPIESMSLNFGGVEFVMYDNEGRPSEAAHYHLGTSTATLKKGKGLEVVEMKKKEKKVKKAKTEKNGADSEVKDGGDKENEK